MGTILRVTNVLLVLLLVLPAFATLVIFPARVDSSHYTVPHKYPSDNWTPRYSPPALPGVTAALRHAGSSTLPPLPLTLPKRTPSSGPRRMGAAFLADVYVNGAAGNDIYDGSSSTVQSGGVGPKKTIQAGINTCMYDGTVHVAQGVYLENIVIDISIWLEGTGARNTIIDGRGLDTVVTIDASGEDIDIMGFTIRNGYGHWAGGIENGFNCALFVTQCAIVNNIGEIAGGIFNEDCYLALGQSLIAGNTALEVGGGVLNYSGVMFMVESTVSGNSLAPGGHEGGGIYSEDAVNYVIDVTLAFNSATSAADSAGGGFSTDNSEWLIINTIVANNRATQAGANNGYFYGITNDLIALYSIDSEDTCNFHGPFCQVNTDPGLALLSDNGGSTDTHAIGVYSAAFDRGLTGFVFVGQDQRGVPRPQGLADDVGAYELALSPTGSVNSAGSGRELVSFSCSQGGIMELTALPPTACSGALPQGVILPYGLFSFRIVSIPVGGTVRVTIQFPRIVPSNFQYWKCNGNGTWVNVTSLVTYTPGGNSIVLALTDGGMGDADGVANGMIVDPGGVAWAVNAQQQSHSAYIAPPQQPVRLPNLSVQSATLSSTSVMPGEPVTVTATVANRGQVNGAMKLSLTVNGEEEAMTGVTVNSGGTAPVTFTVGRDQPGTYSVYAGGAYAGEFTVGPAADPNIILFISSALLCAAFVVGMVMIYRRQTAG